MTEFGKTLHQTCQTQLLHSAALPDKVKLNGRTLKFEGFLAVASL
jgi:hypothetical protein